MNRGDHFDPFARVLHWGMAVLILAIIPNPAFDMVGIFAGALKMPLWRFLLWCWLGKIIKMMAFAYGGNAIFNIFP